MAETTLTKEQIENLNFLGMGVAAALADALMSLKYDGFHPEIIAAMIHGVQQFFQQDVDTALNQLHKFKTGGCKNYHAQMLHGILGGGLVRTLHELVYCGALDNVGPTTPPIAAPWRDGEGESWAEPPPEEVEEWKKNGGGGVPYVNEFDFRRRGDLN